MTATPETKMKTKAERKQAALAAFEKKIKEIDDAEWAEYKKIRDAALDAYNKKVKEIDDEA